MEGGWIGRTFEWLLATKSREPMIRAARVALVIFAVAAVVVGMASDRFVFYALFTLVFAFVAGFATKLLEGKTTALRALGYVFGVVGFGSMILLIVATVTYLVWGVPQHMGRLFAPGQSGEELAPHVTYFVHDNMVVGPILVKAGQEENAEQLAGKIRSRLPPDATALAGDGGIYDVARNRYLLTKEKVEGPGPWLLSSSLQPMVLFQRRGQASKQEPAVQTPPARVPPSPPLPQATPGGQIGDQKEARRFTIKAQFVCIFPSGPRQCERQFSMDTEKGTCSPLVSNTWLMKGFTSCGYCKLAPGEAGYMVKVTEGSWQFQTDCPDGVWKPYDPDLADSYRVQ